MQLRKYAKCPFFANIKGERGGTFRITCEQIKNLGFDVRNQLSFRRKDEMETFYDMFCTDYRYDMCPYYQAIYKKYEEDSYGTEGTEGD